MIQKIIKENEQGQRFDKYLHKLLPNASGSFLYKMLRKKNITLNGKKAEGSEKLNLNDSIELFFADDTFLKFSEQVDETQFLEAYDKLKGIQIIYEDDQVILLDKPSGILSQKAEQEDLSLNEWLIGYLLRNDKMQPKELTTFRPSVCNRLDRNTSGIVLCGKTLAGTQMLSELLKERSLHKFYRCIVEGKMNQDVTLEGYLKKDEKTNKVTVLNDKEYELMNIDEKNLQDDFQRIITKYKPVCCYQTEAGKHTLLEIELITGKTHQIRAHLASVNHPIIGDYKYGNKKVNDRYKESFGICDQLLHAYRVEFPKLTSPFEQISEKTIVCELPDLMLKLLQNEV